MKNLSKLKLALSCFAFVLLWSLGVSTTFAYMPSVNDYDVLIVRNNEAISNGEASLIFYGKLADRVYADLGEISQSDLPQDYQGTIPQDAKILMHMRVMLKMSPPQVVDGILSGGECEGLPYPKGAFRCILALKESDDVVTNQPPWNSMNDEEVVQYLSEPASNVSFRFWFNDKTLEQSPYLNLAKLYGAAVDTDADLVPNRFDNCSEIANYSQADADADGNGDECDTPETTEPDCEADPDAEGCDNANPFNTGTPNTGSTNSGIDPNMLMNDGGACSFIGSMAPAATRTILMMLAFFAVPFGCVMFARKDW